MSVRQWNHLGQPIGQVVPDWKPPPRPASEPMSGRYCRLEPLDAKLHAASLHAANTLDVEGKNWTYFGLWSVCNLGQLLGVDRIEPVAAMIRSSSR